MNDSAKKLLDAHVEYELNQLEEDILKKTIAAETKELWKWLHKTNISVVLPKKEVKAFIHRNKTMLITEPVKEYIVSLATNAYDFINEQDWEIGDILHKKHYDKLVDRALDMEDARKDFIHKMVKNPFYADLITNVLYNGIKSFTTEGGALQKSPMGGLFKLGQGLMHASGLEDTIDTNVKKYISSNLQKSIAQSEKYLQENLSNSKLKKLSNEAWEKVADTDLKEITKWVKPSTVEKSIPLAEEYWNGVSSSKAFKESIDFVIDHFYTENGKKKVAVVLEDLDMNEEKAIREAQQAALPWVKEMLKTGYLEQRIRTRLEGFYTSQKIV